MPRPKPRHSFSVSVYNSYFTEHVSLTPDLKQQAYAISNLEARSPSQKEALCYLSIRVVAGISGLAETKEFRGCEGRFELTRTLRRKAIHSANFTGPDLQLACVVEDSPALKKENRSPKDAAWMSGWQECRLCEVRTIKVESWLRTLPFG